MDNRKYMEKNKDGVIFSIAPNLSEMGDSYLEFIEKSRRKFRSRGFLL